jgi:hypothetical protein
MLVDNDTIYAGLLTTREEQGRKQEYSRYKSSYWTEKIFSVADSRVVQSQKREARKL